MCTMRPVFVVMATVLASLDICSHSTLKKVLPEKEAPFTCFGLVRLPNDSANRFQLSPRIDAALTSE